MNDRQIVLRAPAEVMDRAERLAKVVARRPEYQAVRVTASAVLRMALLIGLDSIEKDAKRR